MKALRWILLYLLFSLLVGLVIGTIIRRRLEEPEIYIGSLRAHPAEPSVGPTPPLDIGHAIAGVLEPGQYEEQIG